MDISGRAEASRRKNLEGSIPGLTAADYELTSEACDDYNCVAWVAGDTRRRWDDENEDLYWPVNAILRDGTFASLIEALQTLEFEACASGEYEDGFEKVAIYGSEGKWRHAAKQLPDGRWSSKCGKLDDIAHRYLTDVNCEDYGTVYGFLKRKK